MKSSPDENVKRIEGLAAFGQLELAKAETKLLAALQKVDARALLTSYTMYRMVGRIMEDLPLPQSNLPHS